ncbi:MAG: DUF362 domain-containing protein [Candidatus Hodarchaeota archaeon]
MSDSMTKPLDQTIGCDQKHRKKSWAFLAIAVASAFWLILRTGRKPSRLAYPCQQAALTNIQIAGLGILTSVPSLLKLRSSLIKMKPVLVLGIIIAGSACITSSSVPYDVAYNLSSEDDYTRVPIVLEPDTAVAPESASNLFFIQNASGYEGNMDPAVTELLQLMESEELYFYKTNDTPSGLIASDDVIILKVNAQWAYRGGTNTDLVKSIINAIINHPDGFTGEIVAADNGQGLGNLNPFYGNAFDRNQAIQDVVDSFSAHDVSTFLWDDLRTSIVDDYDTGNMDDGYVRNNTWHSDTEIYTSYPKFRTEHGTYISFKNGVWDSETGFDSDRLKVINLPVLKSHFRYGLTGCVKNYMGVPNGRIVPDVDPGIPHEHFSIGLGGMATLMVETRAPILNILDMIWVNPHPMESSTQRGPWSNYPDARFTDIIGASQDPVGLDYWASKNVLCATAEYLNYTVYSSLDPDYEPLSEQYYGTEPMDESFHNYLERTMNVLASMGFQVTMDDDEMNVYVTALTGHPLVSPTTTPTPTEPGDQSVLILAVTIPLSAGVLIAVLSLLKRRNQ